MKTGKRWKVGSEPREDFFISLDPIPKPIVRALFHRGIESEEAARVFLKTDGLPLADPSLLTDMDKAAERILAAVGAGEPLVVYGDYDTDGVTATAMLVDFLQSIGASVSPYIPSRFDEGYGLNCASLDELSAQGARVIISVDCGARSILEAEYCRTIGLDLIITDHHPPGAEEPPAFAFVDPYRRDCPYPEKNLSGVGVAFRLVQAIAGRLESKRGERPESYLDLVAIGTVADMVPLTGENRFLVREGLIAINDPNRGGLRPGVDHLMQVAGFERGKLNAQGIGFGLGPRLNASGRLDTASTALNLLLSRDPKEARELAAVLDSQNRRRQTLTKATFLEAREIAARPNEESSGKASFFIMAEKTGFNPGVIGLAASKLMEEFYLPAAVVAVDGEFARGSVRSVPGFHITDALENCQDLLERYGGHAAAAGFTIRTDRLGELRIRLEQLAKESLSGRSVLEDLEIDSEMAFSEVSWAFYDWIKRMEPYGRGNPAPVFFTRGLRIGSKRCVGRDGAHLKLTLSDGRISLDAIGFGMGRLEKSIAGTVDAAFSIEENNYYGRQLQLRIMDLRGLAETG